MFPRLIEAMKKPLAGIKGRDDRNFYATGIICVVAMWSLGSWLHTELDLDYKSDIVSEIIRLIGFVFFIYMTFVLTAALVSIPDHLWPPGVGTPEGMTHRPSQITWRWKRWLAKGKTKTAIVEDVSSHLAAQLQHYRDAYEDPPHFWKIPYVVGYTYGYLSAIAKIKDVNSILTSTDQQQSFIDILSRVAWRPAGDIILDFAELAVARDAEFIDGMRHGRLVAQYERTPSVLRPATERSLRLAIEAAAKDVWGQPAQVQVLSALRQIAFADKVSAILSRWRG